MTSNGSRLSRRTYLTGLAAGAGLLSGCAGDLECYVEDCYEPDPRTPAEPPDPPGEKTPGPRDIDWPVAVFEGRDVEYELQDMPLMGENNLPDDPAGGARTLLHPDSRDHRVEVTADRAVLTIPRISVRDTLTFHLFISTAQETWATKQVEVEPDTEGSEIPPMEELRVEFDISDVALPPANAVGHAFVSVDHRHPYERERWQTPRYALTSTGVRLVKEHYFGRVTLDGPDGPETRWVNDNQLNPVRFRHPNTENTYRLAKAGKGGGIYRHTDSEDGRTFTTIQRFDGALYAARTEIPNDYYEYWREINADNYLHITEAYHAPNIPHLRELAENIWDAHSRVGITDPIERLEATASVVQQIPYEIGESEWMPTVTLHRAKGDCSDKTALFASLLNCEPFDARGAYYRCLYRGARHMALGVDVRDLGYDPGEEPEGWFTFAPSPDQREGGAPDTSYAFIELTDPDSSGFGEPNPEEYTTEGMYDTLSLDLHARRRKDHQCDGATAECTTVAPGEDYPSR